MMRLVYDDIFLSYSHGGAHPESPVRLKRAVERLSSLRPIEFMKPRSASLAELSLVHSPAYLGEIRECQVDEVDDETPVHPNTFDVASAAAGSAIVALDESIRSGELTFSLARPPGHHAFSSKGGGFCYFNNAAIAARACGQKRVAIVDLDVHHGNGTSDIFYAEDTLYISTHQWGIYPGTGAAEETGSGKGEGFNVNIPLPAGSGDATFQYAMQRLILPVLGEYDPDAVLISLGVDAHYTDPLASLSLSTTGYLNLVMGIRRQHESTCIVLEGGYNPDAVADLVASLYAADEGMDYRPQFDEVADKECIGRKAVDNACSIQKQWWQITP